MFTETVKKAVIDSGWYEGRNIDIEHFVSYMMQEGYKLSSTIESFLKEFGDLRVSYVDKNGLSESLHFDAVKAIKDIFLDNVLYYSHRLGNINLCVIGQGFTNHMTFMMNDEGNVFVGYDDYFYKIGNTGYEAIENICLGNALIEVE